MTTLKKTLEAERERRGGVREREKRRSENKKEERKRDNVTE